MQTEDAAELRAFLSADPSIHVYALGDLAPAYWPDCKWHVLRARTRKRRANDTATVGAVRAVAMTYSG